MWVHWLGSLRYVGTLAGVTEVCGYMWVHWLGSLRYVGTLAGVTEVCGYIGWGH